METSAHTLNDLFAQLGLPDTEEGIDAFINAHGPVPGNITLGKADFWSRSQSQFINEALNQDSDWTDLVDQLDARLRA